MQIGQGRGAARGVLRHLCFLVSVGFRSRLCCKFGFLSLVKGRIQWVKGLLFLGRPAHCISVKNATVRAIMFLQQSGLVSFGSPLGPYGGVVKRVAGVGGGARSSRTFFFTFVTLRNSKKSSQPLVITASVCQSKSSLSWSLSFAAHSRRERVCLTEPCRVLQDGMTPLYQASCHGNATVVEQLLAAGADLEAKDAVSGERWMRDADKAGSRGDTQRVGVSLFSCCCLFSLGCCVW